MNERPIYRALAFAALVALLGCKKKPAASEGKESVRSSPVTASSSAGEDPHVIQSKDEVCSLLTTAEVSGELKKPIQPAHQRSIVLGAPTECVYSTGDGSDAAGFAVRLFFQSEPLDVRVGFAHAIFEVCGHDSQERIQSLGDEAVLCSKLLVRKGSAFFILSRLSGDPAVPWADAARRLGSKVVARLP